MSCDRLCFVHQLPTEDRRIVTIDDAGDRISTGCELLEMFAIETSRFRIRVKEDCLFSIDTEFITIVRSVVDSGPAQILRHAAGIAPPVTQTELHVKMIFRCFSDHFVEMNESIFIPLSRRPSKRMTAWPISKISDGLNVAWSTFAESPDAHNFDSCLCCLAQCFRHPLAIFVAIHHCDIRANEPKWLLRDEETSVSLVHKLVAVEFGTLLVWLIHQMHNRRASDKHKRAVQQQ